MFTAKLFNSLELRERATNCSFINVSLGRQFLNESFIQMVMVSSNDTVHIHVSAFFLDQRAGIKPLRFHKPLGALFAKLIVKT